MFLSMDGKQGNRSIIVHLRMFERDISPCLDGLIVKQTFLVRNGYSAVNTQDYTASDFWIFFGKGLESWLKVKLSSGIKREKSDPADSLAIAEYTM